MTMHRRQLVRALGAAATLGFTGPALAQGKKYDEGASDTEIRIGNTAPYSGNASAYGIIGRTFEAVFKQVNDQGGINGRKITFVTYDDGYSPPKTVEMVRKLVEDDKVLAVFAPVGTASNTAVQKYLNQKKVPQLFVGSGASKFGNGKEFPWTMGWQPDYVTESMIIAKHILANVKEPKIGVLMQNDDMGKDYMAGFREGLGKDAGSLIVQHATYETTDPTVDSQMIQLKNSGANVFYNITTPKFAAQAIKKAAEIAWKPAHYLVNVSASVGTVLKPAGFAESQGIISSFYMKDVSDPQWEKDADFQARKAFMEKYMPNADSKDQFTAYGYAVANTLIETLRKAGDNLTRENVMKVAASHQGLKIPLLLPGITVNTSTTDFYPLQSTQLAVFKGERFELVGQVIASESK